MFSKPERARLKIEGMTCGHCAGRVAAALEGVAGVSKVKVELEAGEASVRYRAGSLAPDSLVAAVKSAGYEAAPLG